MNNDELKPAEDLVVVDSVVTSLKKVILVGVIVLDADFPIGVLLANEGPRMLNRFVINDTRHHDEELIIVVLGNKVVENKLLQRFESILPFVSLNFIY